VTPSFNQGRFLEDTILSVLKQDYSNIEYLIIDGGSTDNSVEIIRKYEDRLAFWVSEKDKGQTHAIKKGFRRAKGRFMNWLCSDDVLEPSMVSISVDFLISHPEVGMTYGDRVRIDAKGNICWLQRFPRFRPYMLKWGFAIPQETALFRRKIYDAVGGVDESLKMAMDFDLWCRISNVSRIHHIPAFLGRFRVYGSNKSSLFTDELNKTGFSKGRPAEFATVYQRHFGKNPSAYLMKLERFSSQILAMVERRTQRFQDQKMRIEQVRLS
jgi:glycosyltransferase involved in cell wall biosynthesis